MGKQIQIRTTEIDNIEFFQFIKATFNCDLHKTFANSEIDLKIINENQLLEENDIIYVHNKLFDWKPKYAQTTTKEKFFYIENISKAPIIEFSKTNWEENQDGRIYWAKNFPGEMDYNIEKFNDFYIIVANWFRTNSTGKTKYSNLNTYYLKFAWEKINKI